MPVQLRILSCRSTDVVEPNAVSADLHIALPRPHRIRHACARLRTLPSHARALPNGDLSKPAREQPCCQPQCRCGLRF